MFPLKDDIATRRFPVVTVTIIGICVAVYFLFEQGLWGLGDTGNERVAEYGAVPYEITHPGEGGGDVPWWVTVFTSMFMHGSLLHLGGNMLFLWIFGNNIEDSMTRPRFLAFYLVGGVLALLGQVAVDPGSTVPTVGASGAIAAVLGGYALLYPRARVVTVIFILIIFTVVRIPALIVLGGWVLLQLVYGVNDVAQPTGGDGGVAYFAHLGGFVAGLVLIRLFANHVHEDYDAARRIPVY